MMLFRSGTFRTALRNQAKASGDRTSAMGGLSVAEGNESLAFGGLAATGGTQSVALGWNSIVFPGADGSMALGANSEVAPGVSNSVALGNNSYVDRANAVSVGTMARVHDGQLPIDVEAIDRQIIHVAAGTEDTDAVNLAQLKEVADSVEGASRYFKADGLEDDDAQISGKYAVAAGARSSARGTGTTAMGGSALADGQYATAVGFGSNAMEDDSVAIGAGARASAAGANAFGGSSRASGVNSTAIGTGSYAGAANSVALGAGSVANRANAISVGAAGVERQIVNVAAGTADTDAVNVRQLREAGLVGENGSTLSAVSYDNKDKDSITLSGEDGTVLKNVKAGLVSADSADAVNGSQRFGAQRGIADALGGGSTVNAAGAIVGTSFNVMGGAFGNVGDALQALDRGWSALDGRVTALEEAGPGEQPGGGNSGHVAVDGAGDGSDNASVNQGTGAVAVGSNASAGGNNGTAIGGNAVAVGAGDTAIGGNAKVHADGSTAVGANSTIAAAGTNAVAMGEGSSVQAASGTSLGQGAKVGAGATGAVALGQGSVADRANTVSVGSVGHERQVANVADGSRDTDAANVRQVNAGDAKTLTQSKAYTDARFQEAMAAPMAAVDDLRDMVGKRFDETGERIDRMGAMNAAMINMATSAAGVNKQNRVGVGAGFSGNAQALSVGYQRAINDSATLTIGGAFSDEESSAGVGLGFGW
jgi:autotransporter adhesin